MYYRQCENALNGPCPRGQSVYNRQLGQNDLNGLCPRGSQSCIIVKLSIRPKCLKLSVPTRTASCVWSPMPTRPKWSAPTRKVSHVSWPIRPKCLKWCVPTRTVSLASSLVSKLTQLQVIQHDCFLSGSRAKCEKRSHVSPIYRLVNEPRFQAYPFSP